MLRLCLQAAVLLAVAVTGAAPLRADPVAWMGDARAFDAPFADGRRTGSRFGANLGRNLVGVVSGESLKPFLVGFGIAGAGSFLDRPTERFFAGQHRADDLGRIGASFGRARFLAPATGALFAAGRASGDPRFRAATYDATQALIVDMAWTTAIKLATERERPDGSNRLSFPSGHTSTAFAWATVASHYYGLKVGIPAFAAAGLVGVSRLETNAHHLSDVLAGATVGYIVGRTTVRRDGEPLRERRHLALAPSVGPSGSGVGLAVSLEF